MIYDKPLSASLTHYHPCFNPAIDDDPLIFFGGVDRKLPRKSLEDSQKIRDLLWHWSSPHFEGLCDLPTIIDKFHQVNLTPDIILEFSIDSITYYSVPPLFLEDVTQLFLAVYQVLKAFQAILEEGKHHPFIFDPEWRMLKMLAWHTNKENLLLCFIVLQHCCKVCNSHIKEYFKAMHKIFLQTDKQESISTLYSTHPSICSQFGRGSIHKEVGKLLLCPNYVNQAPAAYCNGLSCLTEAAVTAANKMNEKVLTNFYNDTSPCGTDKKRHTHRNEMRHM